MKKAVEVGKLDIRQAAALAASDSVRSAVGDEISIVVNQVTHAAKQMSDEAERTFHNIRSYQQVTWDWGKCLLAIFCASILSSLMICITLYCIGALNVNPANLSDTDDQALQKDRALDKVWNKLSQKEQDHINELVKSTQRQ